MSEKLVFDEIIGKRGNDNLKQKNQQLLPTQLYQCIAFYGKQVLDEIEELYELNKVVPILGRKTLKEINETLNKQRFIFPFYSKEIFMSQQEAEQFLPFFIKELIKEGKIPEEVIKEDRSVDDDKIKFAITTLIISTLEQEKTEFRGFNNI